MIPATRGGAAEWLKDLLALAAGGLSVLAFAPYQLYLLGPLSLFTLFRTWRHASAGRSAVRGYLYGLGQYGAGVYWVYISMHSFSGASVWEAAVLTVLFVALVALYPALAGYLATKWMPSTGWWVTLVYPAAWVGIEWLRGWLLTGFPWLQMGYAHVGDWLGLGLAPLGGVYAVSLAVSLIAALLLVVTGSEASGRHRLVALSAIGGVVFGCYQLSRIEWTQPVGHPISVALLQGNVSQQIKWEPAAKQSTLSRYRELTRQNWSARLIVWPETAIPSFLHQVRDGYLNDIQAEAAEHGTDVLVGVPVQNQESGQYYNAVVSLSPKAGMYFKRHMVPFGEYLPMRPLLGFILEVLQIPLADFQPGDEHQTPLSAVGSSLAASICFEDAFGYEVRKGLPEAGYLVNVTNDAWFGNSIEPFQHHQMARMRALETGRYLLRATNTGITSIISPQGRVVTQLPIFWEGALQGQFQIVRGATPYVRYGDSPVLMTLGLAVVFLHLLKRRRDSQSGESNAGT